jgi:adenosylmethionine-8-amino-7-oxononanoate aminotransferase
MTRDEVYQSFYSDSMARGFLHSHSYTGNPLACRAALATLAIFEEDDVLAGNLVRAEKLSQALKPFTTHSKVKHFRQQGMIWAFDAQVDDLQLAATFSRRFFASALKHELLLRPIGTTVYVMPPFILSDADNALLAERLHTVFDEVIRA